MRSNVLALGKVRYYKRSENYQLSYINQSVDSIEMDADYERKMESIPHLTVLESFLVEFNDKVNNIAGLILMRYRDHVEKTFFFPVTKEVYDKLKEKDSSIPFIGDLQQFKIELLF